MSSIKLNNKFIDNPTIVFENSHTSLSHICTILHVYFVEKKTNIESIDFSITESE